MQILPRNSYFFDSLRLTFVNRPSLLVIDFWPTAWSSTLTDFQLFFLQLTRDEPQKKHDLVSIRYWPPNNLFHFLAFPFLIFGPVFLVKHFNSAGQKFLIHSNPHYSQKILIRSKKNVLLPGIFWSISRHLTTS